MRRSILPAMLLLLAACASDVQPTDNPPAAPPPPATPGAPASLQILTGDGQTGVPGGALPVRLSVLVKDATGLAVPNITVHFAADSGGGSLDMNSAITGSNGIALGGTWTLGPSSGSNVASATVGSLAPARYHAQGFSTTARTLFDKTTVGMAGGTIKYVKPGDPLNGLTVTVPAAAYKAPTTWTIVADSTIVVPLPATFSQVGPALVIGNTQDYADSLMTLTMPIHLAAGQTAAPFYFDPATGTLEGIPLVAATDTSMTLASKHFTSNEVAIPGSGLTGGGLRAGLRMGFGTVIVVWVRTNTAQLIGSWLSKFQPGVDDWEFTNYGDYISPGGDCEGMSVTAMYWHYYFNPNGGAGLFHKFDQSVANQWDNIQGIRFAGSIQGDFDAVWRPGINQAQTLINQGRLHGTRPDLFTARWILLTIKLTGQPVLLNLAGPAGGHAVVAYAADFDGSDTNVAFADPNHPGVARVMSFDATGMTPVSLQTSATGPASFFTVAWALSVTADVPLNQLLSREAEFRAGRAGSDRYPKNYHLERHDQGGGWVNLPANAEVWTTSPTLELRHTCMDCPIPTSAGNNQQLLVVWNQAGSAIDNASRLAPDPLPEGNSGYEVALNALSPFGQAPNDTGFVDAVPITVNFHAMTVVIPGLVLKDSLVTLHANVATLGTPQSVYTWDFGDGTTPITLSADSVITHRFIGLGSTTVTVTLSDPKHGVIGTASTAITVETQRVTFIVQGPWDTLYAPPGGVYTYAPAGYLGVRYSDPSGVDAIFIGYNVVIGGGAGIAITLVTSPGTQLVAGQTFTKTVAGQLPAPGQFNVIMAPDQANPVNVLRPPIGSGTLLIDTISQMSDGTWVAKYQFNVIVSNGATLSGSGVAAWK